MQKCWQNVAYVAFPSRCPVPQRTCHLSGVSLGQRQGSLNTLIQDSRDVRLEKQLGGHLVQLARFAGEASEPLRGDTVGFGQSLQSPKQPLHRRHRARLGTQPYEASIRDLSRS